MLKHSLLVFLALTCLNLCFLAPAEVKRCVFSIEVIRDGGGMVDFGYTAVGDGIFLYEHADGQITGERYQRLEPYGTVRRVPEREVFGAGPKFTRRVRELFKKSAIGELDFRAELLAADQAYTREMESGGKALPITVVTGARTIKVYADLEGARFTFSESQSLDSVLRSVVNYNERLKALKILLEGIALEYGRSRIFID